MQYSLFIFVVQELVSDYFPFKLSRLNLDFKFRGTHDTRALHSDLVTNPALSLIALDLFVQWGNKDEQYRMVIRPFHAKERSIMSPPFLSFFQFNIQF